MAAAELFHLPAIVHGRVLVEGPPEPAAVLVGFHGYGQRAEDALEFLRPLAAGRPWALAAPQALHPFYRRNDQEVVACWMTRLDRELALADNVAYVARAVGELRRRLPGARLAIVGFSQGVAMAYRAAARCGHAVDALVALAGDVPPELREVPWGARPAVLLGRGSREEWYREAQLEEDLRTLAALGLQAEACRFEGGHEWAPAFVEHAREFLAARLE